MTQNEYLERMSELWPDSGEVSEELLALSEEAVQAFPDAPELWCMRGHLVEIASEEGSAPIQEARACYERAIQVDPDYADGWESLGYYLDNYDDDVDGAEQAFRKAVQAGGDADSYIGLARVLAQQGRTEAALSVISAPQCPYAELEEVQAMRDEIEDGLWTPEQESEPE